MKISCGEDFTLEARIGKKDRHFPELVFCRERELRHFYNGMEYGLTLTAGRFDGPGLIRSEAGTVEVHIG